MKSSTVEMIEQEPSYTLPDLGGEIFRNSVAVNLTALLNKEVLVSLPRTSFVVVITL